MLGAWQMQRLQWKESLIATIAARGVESPIDISTWNDTTPLVEWDYRHAHATGTFLHDHEFYRTALSLDGKGGYHVLTPLHLNDGRFVLIDRGFVPYEKKLPATRVEGQSVGEVTVKGLLRLPQKVWLSPPNQPDINQWYATDLPAMAKIAGVPAFMPFVLEVDTAPNAGGFPIGGQTRLELPNNHLGYALTWFGLALGLTVIYFVSSWKRD